MRLFFYPFRLIIRVNYGIKKLSKPIELTADVFVNQRDGGFARRRAIYQVPFYMIDAFLVIYSLF